MARTKHTTTPSVPTKEFATVRQENASASKVTKEKAAGAQLAQKAVRATALASTSTSLLEITTIDVLALGRNTEQSQEPKLATQLTMHRMCPPSLPKPATRPSTTVSFTIYGMHRRSKVANATWVTPVLTVPPE
jgi:hypothetical protein